MVAERVTVTVSLIDAWVLLSASMWLASAVLMIRRFGFGPGAVFGLLLGGSGIALLWL